MDDGGYFADAPGHLCGGLPRESWLPPYRLLISLVRRARLDISGCGVGPPSPGVPSVASASQLQQWWNGLQPDLAAIGNAWNSGNCSAMLTQADNAVAYLDASTVPPAYDNLTVALDNAIGDYQGAAGYCPTEPSVAAGYVTQGDAWIQRADNALVADGGHP